MSITPLTVTIDLNPSYKKIPAVYVSQLDNNLRELAITVQDGGVNYNVASSGYDVYIEGTKPDMHGFSYDVTDIGGTVAGSVITVPMQTQMTCVKGMVSTEIVLKSGSDRIGSANFLLVVERAGLAEDVDVSETDIPAYIDGAQRAAEAAEQAKDDAVEAKNTAVAVAASIPEDYTTLSNDVDDLKSALIALEQEGYPYASIETAVNAWAEDNQYEIVNNYVTPEMFGAKGDGQTDDTPAIQQAINNAGDSQVYFSNKTYLISDSIQLSKFNIVNDGTILYTGQDYALIYAPTSNVDGAYSKFGTVLAPNGNVLHIDSANAWIQYVTIDFKTFTAGASKTCVRIDVVGYRWVNEIRFINGRFSAGNYGVYLDHSQKLGNGFTSHLTFNLIGFEGVTHGVYLPSKATRVSFTNCRAEENLTDVVYSDANSSSADQLITWVGSVANGTYWQNCNNYYVLFLSGYINTRGTPISSAPIMYYNGMLYGLDYTNGAAKGVVAYGAYTYDDQTHIQEIDFAKVYDYTTAGVDLYERPHTRIFNVSSNNTSATETDIYLDDRMFLQDFYEPSNSYLIELTVSPSVLLRIYDKRGGTLLYSMTNGNTTQYPRFVITGSHKLYTVQKVDFTRKSV